MEDPVLEVAPLGFQWATVDPFLFCVHHVDRLSRRQRRARARTRRSPAATSAWTSRASTVGACTTARPCPASRSTRTAASRPSPSCGAASSTTPTRSARPRASAAATCSGSPPARASCTARCSRCSNAIAPNPLELFQIWLNLPAADKMVDPYFTMLWNEDLPRHVVTDDDGARHEVTVIAGELAGLRPPPPPPDSWASRPESDLAIWHIDMAPGAQWTLPPAAGPDTVRVLYVFEGDARVGEHDLDAPTGARLRVDDDVDDHRRRARRGGARAAGPADRRARRAARPVRHERRGRHRAGVRRLPRAPVSAAGRGRPTTRCTHATPGASRATPKAG